MKNTETKHKYYDILQAISLGKPLQWKGDVGDWRDENAHTVLAEISEETYEPENYRAKPDTATINGVEVERPMTKAPEAGTRYWYAYVGRDEGYASDTWTEHTVDHERLASGMCWSAESGVAGAINAFKAALTA
jgi:hypothetical protein